MEQKQERCPICENHCTKGAEQCERGQAFFQHGNSDMPGNHHGHGPHHGEHHRPHHGRCEDNPSMDGLSSLFMQCGHHIFRYSHERGDRGDEPFANLSDAERTELERLLKKLLAYWSKQK